MTDRDSTQRKKDRKRIAAARPNCALCGEPIDYTLEWPDKWCFVVDHIIPVAAPHYGPDILSNKQAAHNDCNSKKRKRLIAPTVRRSGSLT